MNVPEWSSSYDPWPVGRRETVCFYKNPVPTDPQVEIIVTDTTDPHLADHLRLFTNHELAFDAEWDPHDREAVICLYQFCDGKVALLVRDLRSKAPLDLAAFMRSHHLVAKGAYNDKKKLMWRFGEEFDIEDIERSRMTQREVDLGMIWLVEQVDPRLCDLKDKTVSRSDWMAPVLTVRQVLYAAFDVVVIFWALPKLGPYRPPRPTRKEMAAAKAVSAAPAPSLACRGEWVGRRLGAVLDE